MTPHAGVYTTTHQRIIDGALDRISLLERQHDEALQYIVGFLRRHPEHDDDRDLAHARLVLL